MHWSALSSGIAVGAIGTQLFWWCQRQHFLVQASIWLLCGALIRGHVVACGAAHEGR